MDPKRLLPSLGKLNDACGVLSKSIMVEEDDTPKNLMLIMLVSHKFGSERSADTDYHLDLPYCSLSFPSRIGILANKADELEIATMAKIVKFLNHDEYLATSLARLSQCMQDSCCIETNMAPPTTCTRSTPLSKRTEVFTN